MSYWGDFHTHTVFSDGQGSVEDNVLAARKLGLKAIAITDHGICNYPRSLHPEDIFTFMSHIERCRKLYPDIRIYAGAEANLVSVSGNIDISEEGEALLDFVICGWHTARFPPKLKDGLEFWIPNFLPLIKSTRAQRIKNTDAYINAMQKNNVSVIAHPLKSINCDLKPVGELAKELGIYLELNSKSPQLESEDYETLAKTGCEFICSSDAHSPQRVGDFSAADGYRAAGMPMELVSNWERFPAFRIK